MTPEQMAFARAHGITRCPPGPEFRVLWGGSVRRPRSPELSDAGELQSAGQLRIRSLFNRVYRLPAWIWENKTPG